VRQKTEKSTTNEATMKEKTQKEGKLEPDG
jgi:hypothetical protein